MLGSLNPLAPELGLTSRRTGTAMEKNPNSNANSNKAPPRSSSTGPTAGESKPKTDGKNNGGSKRYSRKREPSLPKSDIFPGPRRTNSQKSKNFDKRPPQRGGVRQCDATGGGRREEVAECRRAEFSPAQFAGPKKISLNHLLNFTFEPRGGHDGHSGWGRRNKWGHKHKPFNKELFLQANCQFVVTDDQDYKAHFTDPDTLVNWDCVQQVRIYSHEVPTCPICLYPPVAAHITRCGHIFCWPCMLHYLSLSDKSWSKCPICYESVHSDDLKSVVAMETRQYAVGDLITMRLMRREKGALVAMPSSQWVKVEEPIRFGDVCLSPYSKLLLASQEQVLGLVAEEKAALQFQLTQEEDSTACFIQSALCSLQEREEALLSVQKACTENPDLSSLTLAEPPFPDEVVTTFSSTLPVLQYSSAFDDEVVEFSKEDPEEAQEAAEFSERLLERVLEELAEVSVDEAPEPCFAEDNCPSQIESVLPKTSEHGPYYYFYQADDCQQMFLHPVNVRCLLREYGSLEASPDTITATVVEIEGQSITEEIRRRHRYLAHLPLTCEFSICELALQPPTLSKETLDSFADDLEKRKRLRQKKARDEKRRERRIEMEENKKQGRYPEVHIGLENLQHFPAFGPSSYHGSPPVTADDLLAPLSPLSCGPCSDGMMFPSLSGHSPAPSVGSLEEDSHCMSFAQMLRDGKARADAGQKISSNKDMLLAPPVADSDGESDGSDRVPVPSFQNSFSQAFEVALLQLDHGPTAPPLSVIVAEEMGGKKKKKQKQKLLFSTSMVHTNSCSPLCCLVGAKKLQKLKKPGLHCGRLTASRVLFTGMAAQVEVPTGEVGRTGVGGRLRLSPLADSSNKSLKEGLSNTQGSLIITPEPSKPAPGPKPRLTPKPFTVEKTPTIRPIVAPKPNTKTQPEPTGRTSYKPDPPSAPKPHQPHVTSKHRPVPTNTSRPSPTSYKHSPKFSTGQTIKPVAQPFKPAPTLTLGDPSKPVVPQLVERQKPSATDSSPCRGTTKPSPAEWAGSTKQDKEWNKTASTVRAGGASMTRAKSLGFLSEIGLEEETNEGPEVKVQLRPHSKGSRNRPVSAIFLPSPTQTNQSNPGVRWVGRRPLSADLTARFESIGLSLHRGQSANTDSKENSPEEVAPLPRRRERAKGAEAPAVTPPSLDGMPSSLAQVSKKKTEDEKEENGEGKAGGSIKRRISLFLDSSSSSPVVPPRVAAQGMAPCSPIQAVPDADVLLGGVQQRIRKLTEDTVTPTDPTSTGKQPFKPRPLPSGLTKRFGSERSPDLGSPSPKETTGRHESDTDPQSRGTDSVFVFRDQRTADEDTKWSPEHPGPSDPSAGPTEAGPRMETEAQGIHRSSGVQTVRAALFDNVVERCSVLVMEEDRPPSATKGCPKRCVSLEDGEFDDTLVTATYREPLSPSSPLRVEHSFDTVLAVGERRAVSELVPSAQLEDKAMTLRSRRSVGNRPARAEQPEERAALIQTDSSQTEQTTRYLRVGALQKWNTSQVDRESEKILQKDKQLERDRNEEVYESQGEAERRLLLEVEGEKQRSQERAEVAAPKRLKMFEADEPKPRATYFALTGQIHGHEERGNMEVAFDDAFVKPGHWASQGKILHVRRNPSLDEALGKGLHGQEPEEELIKKYPREKGKSGDKQTGMEEMEIEGPKQIHFEKLGDSEREKPKQLEIEGQKQRELETGSKNDLAEEKERDLKKQQEQELEQQKQQRKLDQQKQQQRELDQQKQQQRELDQQKQQQRELEQQKQQQRELEQQKQQQRELDQQKQRELEQQKQQQQELEQQKQQQRELEQQKQRELDQQKQQQRELDQQKQQQRELEQQQQRELEQQKQQQRELEQQRQRELEQQRQRELEQQRQRELEQQRQRELEQQRQRELEQQRQRELEQQRQRELEQQRQRELEQQRQRELEQQRQRELEQQRQRELEQQRQRELEQQRQRELEQQRQRELEQQRQRELEQQRQRELEQQRQRELEQQRLRELEKLKLRELEQQWLRELEQQRLRELEQQRLRELAQQRQRELAQQRQRELEQQRQRELEQQRQRELEQQRQRELEQQRQRELEQQRQRELEQQKEFEKEKQRQLDLKRQMLERRRVEALEMEKRQLVELEKHKQVKIVAEQQSLREEMMQKEKMRQQAIQLEVDRLRELERERQCDLGKQKQTELERLRQKQMDFEIQEMENQRERKGEAEKERKTAKEEREKMRQVARQQETERLRILERQRRENQERLDTSPLRPKVLDIDSVSLGEQHTRGSPKSPGARWKQPSTWADDLCKPGVLDIDSFRFQSQTSPKSEVVPLTSIQGLGPASGDYRSQRHTPERDGMSRMAPEGAVGRPKSVWAPSQQELWDPRLGGVSVDMPMAGPEPPRKPVNKPSLEQILRRQDRTTAPILVPERPRSGIIRRETHSSGSSIEQARFFQDPQPQGHKVAARGQRRSQGSQELNRMRSRSVSRRSAPSESVVDGNLSRMRSRSAHRERNPESWEQLKQSVRGAEEEGRDGDALVQETDSQYGTWETGLHTDHSNLSPSPRKLTSPHTPGEHALSSDLDTPDGFSPSGQSELQPLSFPEASTALLDSSALRSRMQLSKLRGPRSRPTRTARQAAALSVPPEGHAMPTEDWRSRDSTEDKVDTARKEDSDSEEQARGGDPRLATAASQPQRVALFPGMDPSALKAQLKKRGDSDNQTDSPSPLSRSPKSPFLTPRAPQLGEEASPQWLKELKTKKRLSQYDNDN
ncbi:hypothetical protein DPEC_G00262420 [Dallia pectoralis]|uniref:Uncharacterized protein n=1 Tax=Dallia pectoralis TaxID=75939 RepID=A0ACC2FS70_DALPE|nr:hypothetical protein DPEC_G00262420 [Dallia pectoralis]